MGLHHPIPDTTPPRSYPPLEWAERDEGEWVYDVPGEGRYVVQYGTGGWQWEWHPAGTWRAYFGWAFGAEACKHAAMEHRAGKPVKARELK